MYNNPYGEENITNDVVYQALESLNNKFAQKSNGTPFNQSIRFELAKYDPDGNCTSGINHVQVEPLYSNGIVLDTWAGGAQDSAYKAQSYWGNSDHQYCNIWVVNNVLNCVGQTGFVGYASFPFALPEPHRVTDGVALEFNILKSNTFVHELGHYLGLYHLWGPLPIDTCFVEENSLLCPYGDGVDDTTPVKSKNTQDVCFEGDLYPFWNLMSQDGRREEFTQGQIDRATYWIVNSRAGLTSASNLINTIGYSEYIAEIVDSGEVWNTPREFNKDVIINAGATLSIRTTVKMSAGTKIVVKPGAKLDLNNALLTTVSIENCGQNEELMWDGIEVQGDSTKLQSESNQGTLVMQSSTIENAITAVRLYGPNLRNSGGQLFASVSTFRNNITGGDAISIQIRGALHGCIC